MEYFLIWSWFINNFIIINSVHMMVVQTSWLLLPVVDALGLQSNKKPLLESVLHCKYILQIKGRQMEIRHKNMVTVF